MSYLINKQSLLRNVRDELVSLNENVGGLPRTYLPFIRLFDKLIRDEPTVDAIELGVEYDTNKYDITISMNSGEREVDEGHSKLFVVRESSTFKVEKRE